MNPAHHYSVFAKLAGKRFHLLIFVIAIGGLTESLGIGAFVPLLNAGAVVQGEASSITRFVDRSLARFGIESSFDNLLVLILVVFLFKGLASITQAALSARIKASLTEDVRSRLIDSLRTTSFTKFLGLHTGFLTNVVSVEADRAVAAFSHYTSALVSAVYVVAYAGLALLIDWQGALLMTGLGVAVAGSLTSLHRVSRRYSVLTSERNARLQDLLIQTIQSFKYLKATDGFSPLSKKVKSEIAALARYVFRLGFVTASLTAIAEPVGALVLVILLYVNVSLMGRPLSAMLVLALLLYRLVSKLLGTQANWQKFNASIGGLEAVEKAFEMMGDEPDGCERTEALDIGNGIELRDVSFSYDQAEVLHNVSLDIRTNTTVAIVGSTGAGKSTIVNLVTGLLNPSEGDISFGGTPYRSLDKKKLRELVGYVTQESVIFNDSIANNVSLWACDENGDGSTERMRQAVRDVHAESFVEASADTYATVLGSQGQAISGGQRQQISIARELFKNPQVLILDEAMSALDAQSEWLIQQTLSEWRGRLTILLVTHRLSTVKDCDYVYVIGEGSVMEHGTFDDLYSNPESKLRQLAELQGL